MAQALTTPGDKRHGFSFRKAFSYPDIGRISGLAVTNLGNVIMCDNLRNTLVLFDEDGTYLSYLPVEGGPWDIAINKDNAAIVTIPNKSKILVVDPDILYIQTLKDADFAPACVSSLINSSNVMIRTQMPIHIPEDNYYTSVFELRLSDKSCGSKMYSRQYSGSYFHYICSPGENAINIVGPQHYAHNFTNPTLTVPSDICADDNGHIYVSGQYSHTIHRLRDEGNVIHNVGHSQMSIKYPSLSVLDIPLDSRHGIKHPVAMCFNQACTKFYVSNKFGTSIHIYDVV